MARDLSQLQKNGDATHYKVASSWTIQDLSQYFGTDWNLALKTTGNSVILANDTNGYLYQNLINDNQTDYSFFFFPLKNEIKLLKIKIDARCESYNQGTGYFGSDLCSMGVLLNNSQQSGSPNQRVITWTKTTASTVDDIKLEVDDTDWHTYERTLSTPIVGDYFGFFMLKGIWRVKNIELTIPEIANGGGATHIAKRTGQLKDLSSYTSDILIVSGGGGGGLIVGEDTYTGKEAGGISGSGDNSADQSTGNAFGQGESGTNASGGGSGLYGGYKGTSAKSGGAGSGYIGNSLLSNKKMVGYNVPTSSATGTKTESVEVYDSNYVANKPKAGNGHCRIKLLNEVTINDAFDLFTTTDVSSKVVNSYSKDRIYLNPSEDTYTDFVSYLGNPDYMLVGGQDSNGKKTPTIDTVNKTIAYTNTSMGSSASWTLIPITQLSNVIKIKATIKFDSKYNQYSSLIIKLYYIDGNTLVTGNSYEIYIPWQSSSNYNVGDWYDLEVNCSMAKCDYICFGTGWDTVTFKNIKLYSM